MNSIELTEEHKFKLLEMCEKLFPEYTTIQFGSQSNYYLENEEILDFYNEEEELTIHWFELCTINLWNELYLKLGNLELKSYYELLLNNLTHPVDYLYEEFKKLK